MHKKSDKILYSGNWLELRIKDDWFEYIHFKKSNSKTVAILVFDSDKKQILARLEKNPCQTKNLHITSITGACDFSKDSQIVAQREILEEAGYDIDLSNLINLGSTFAFKGSDIKVDLFAIDVRDLIQKELLGDDSKGEMDASTEWLSVSDLFLKSNCSIQALIYLRLISKFPKYNFFK